MARLLLAYFLRAFDFSPGSHFDPEKYDASFKVIEFEIDLMMYMLILTLL